MQPSIKHAVSDFCGVQRAAGTSDYITREKKKKKKKLFFFPSQKQHVPVSVALIWNLLSKQDERETLLKSTDCNKHALHVGSDRGWGGLQAAGSGEAAGR